MKRPILLLSACLLWSAPSMATEPIRVELVKVHEVPLTFDATLTGTIRAKDNIDLGFRLGGRVTEVLVAEGDRVAKGQSLARTDPTQQQQALNASEAAVASAMATEAQARQASDRAKAMLSRGVGTRAALDAAAQSLSAAEGALAQANTALGQAQRALEDTVLRAPTDAVVTERVVEPGQIVAAAQSVMSLAAAEGREAIFQTPDSGLLKNAIGARVSLQLIDFPAQTMTGRVSEISPLVDPASGSVTVHATILDPPADIEFLGSAVHGTIHFPDDFGIAIPWTALTASAGSPAVWVVGKDGRVNLADVAIERFADGMVILRSGLIPGQTVVGAGAQMLYPGRQVVVGENP